jgi:Bacterial PH domain
MRDKSARARSNKSIRRVDLHSGEDVVLVARPARAVMWPKYLYTLGLYGIWRKRNTFVLTDRRVLIGKGVFGRTEKSIPLNRVDDAVYIRRGIAAYAELVCRDRFGRRLERIGPLSPRRAKRFTHEVLARS